MFGSAAVARRTRVGEGSMAVTRWPGAARSRLTLPSAQPTSRVRFSGGGTRSKNAGEYFQYASKSGRRAHAAQLPDSFSQCSRDTGLNDRSAVVVGFLGRARHAEERFDMAGQY